MNRREVLLKLLSTVPATAGLAEAVTKTAKHWLDSVSSEDIETALRDISDETYRQFRRSIVRLRRRSQARVSRERRTDNIVLWRGVVTDDLPPEILARLAPVGSRRRDVRITSVNAACVWQGETLFPGSRILIDSRVREIVGSLAEIIETPHKGRRVHIWPAGIRESLGN